jgi:hypothetical protein
MPSKKGATLTNDKSRSALAVYLVVVQDMLIQQDIAQAIEEFSQNARIVLADSLTNAVNALGDIADISMAFVAAMPDAFLQSPLASELAKRRADVVLAGVWDDDSAQTRDWAVLRYPFSTADIHNLLSVRPSAAPQAKHHDKCC